MKRITRIIGLILMGAMVLSSCSSLGAPLATGTPMPPSSPTLPPPSPTLPPPSPTLPPPSPTPPPFALTSPAFEGDGQIPERYGCRGENVSPPLSWTPPPPGTQSLVLVMDDPDAVQMIGYAWTHWVLFNLPAEKMALSEGVEAVPELPDGSRHGRNGFAGVAYGGPCPPGSQTHTYLFTLYAVDTVLDLYAGTGKAILLEEIKGHILAQAELRGSYSG